MASQRVVFVALLLMSLLCLVTVEVNAQWGFAGRARPTADLYGDLGVSRGASKREVKKRFRTLAKEQHPDNAIKPGMSDDEIQTVKDNFAKVLRAYNILSDDQKRALYDNQGIIDGENDAQAKQQQQFYSQHGGFHGFFRPKAQPILSASPDLDLPTWRGVLEKRRGARIAIVQLYHDDCYECKLFSGAWESVAKGAYSSVVDFYRVDVASNHGHVVATAMRAQYPPAPSVLAVVDGEQWPMEGLEGVLSPRYEHHAAQALEKFIDGFYADLIGRKLLVAIRGQSGRDVAEWVVRSSARFGDRRVQVVFPSATDIRVVLAVVTNFGDKVDVAVAPGGMSQLTEFTEGFLGPGRKLLSAEKVAHRTDPRSQRDAVIVFNRTTTTTATTTAAVPFPREAHVQTSGSRLAVKRVLEFVKEALEVPRGGNRKGTLDEHNRQQQPPGAPIPQWTSGQADLCRSSKRFCLVVVSRGSDCATAATLPEWADPVSTIAPFEPYFLCAGSDSAARRYWETLQGRRGATTRTSTGERDDGHADAAVIAFSGEDDREVAVFVGKIAGRHDAAFHDFLADAMEGKIGAKLSRRDIDELGAMLRATKPFKLPPTAAAKVPHGGKNRGADALPASLVQFAAKLGISDLSLERDSAGNSLLRQIARDFSPFAFDDSGAFFPVARMTRLRWSVTYWYTRVPFANLLPIVGIYLLFKLLSDSSAPRGGRRTGAAPPADPAAAGNTAQRAHQQPPHQQHQQQQPFTPSTRPSASSSASKPSAAASPPQADAAPLCPIFGIPYLAKEDYAADAARPFVIVCFSRAASLAAVPATCRVDPALRHEPKIALRRVRDEQRRWWELLRELVRRDVALASQEAAHGDIEAGPVWFVAIRTARKTVGLKPRSVMLSDWIAGLLDGRFAARVPLDDVKSASPNTQGSRSPEAASAID